MRVLTVVCVGTLVCVLALSMNGVAAERVKLDGWFSGSGSSRSSSSSSSRNYIDYKAAIQVAPNKQIYAFNGYVQLPSANAANFEMKMGLRGDTNNIEFRWKVLLHFSPRSWGIVPTLSRAGSGNVQGELHQFISAPAYGGSPMMFQFAAQALSRQEWHKWSMGVANGDGSQVQSLGVLTSEVEPRQLRRGEGAKYSEFYVSITAHVDASARGRDSTWVQPVQFPSIDLWTTDDRHAYCDEDRIVRSGSVHASGHFSSIAAHTLWPDITGSKCTIHNFVVQKAVRADGEDEVSNNTVAESAAEDGEDALKGEAEPVAYEPVLTTGVKEVGAGSGSSSGSSGGGVAACVVLGVLAAVAAAGAAWYMRRGRKLAAGPAVGEGAELQSIQGHVPHQQLGKDEEPAATTAVRPAEHMTR